MTASLSAPMQSFAQANLDQFLFESFFRGKRDGVFVDVGAKDGRKLSNSLFFERFLGWTGLCVEPRADYFTQLVAQRRCICEQARIDVARDQREVGSETSTSAADAPARELGSLLDQHSLGRIDYCSIDTNGREFGVIAGLDLDRFPVSLFSVHDARGDDRIAGLLADRGYDLVGKLATNWIFRRHDLRRLPRTTVICAVWHRDADRERLLQAHAANLGRQTVPVEAVYVFDGADEPPRSISSRVVVVHEPLSVYQAWNVGLALVGTPFVMNLNLDDRLAPDAIEHLERALLAEGAALAGGDWRVCYSQDETDAVEHCSAADQVPFVADWPPRHGTVTRLGTDKRGTLGPATLWRMDAHIGAPRYPWRLPDGTVLKVAGDIGWWQIVTQHLKRKVVRVPEIIGNYHSHPGSQAEFRGDRQELTLMGALGVNLL